MKKQILIIATLVSGYIGAAQATSDKIDIADGKTNQSFYSLADGEVANVDNQDWDIALDVSSFGSVIRVNGQNGVELKVWPNGAIADWASVAITDVDTWAQNYNSVTDWYMGAFDQNSISDTDVGWGIYNTATHKISGDSIFVIKLSDDSYRKIKIDQLLGGVYTFTYAKIDGSGEKTVTITKSDYTGKNFGYYSLLNEQELDREPASDDWDFVLGKYFANAGSEASPYYMSFTGILTNAGVTVSEARATTISSVTQDDNAFESTIDIIGSDWKGYDFATHSYTMVDTVVYFVNDKEDNIWKVAFTKFTTANGETEFTKELLSKTVAGFEDYSAIRSLAVYPNPASSEVHVLFSTEAANAQLTISDLLGNPIRTETIEVSSFSDYVLGVNELASGVYYLSLLVDGQTTTEKLIVE